jgi:methanethiol S-methyltransferase
MKRTLYLAYGMAAYLAFLGTIFFAICFFGNIILSKTIDGTPSISLWKAVLLNSSLLIIFAMMYSMITTHAFKKWWIRIVPEPLKRISFVLLMSLSLTIMMWLWQPMGGNIWKIENGAVQSLIMILYLSGWMIVFASTFLINHFDLFGFRQVWFYYQGRKYESLQFRLPVFYKIVRHPLYFGFLIAVWSASTMTVAHLLFSVLSTVYVLRAIQSEELVPVSHFVQKYTDYRKWKPTQLLLGRKKAKV